jgi:hypothetical protein
LEPPVPLIRGEKDRRFFEEEDRLRRLEHEKRRHHLDYVVPKFAMSTHVGFCDNLAQLSGSGKVVRIIKPGERGNAYRTLQGALDPDMEVLYEIDTIAATMPGYKGWVRESLMWKTKGAKRATCE